MNGTSKHQVSVSCHTPWQRPLSLLLVILALLSATSPVAAEHLAVVTSSEDSQLVMLEFTAASTWLADQELAQIRGRHTEPVQIQTDNHNDTAVILWDEIKSGNNRNQHQQAIGVGNTQNNSLSLSY